MYVQQNLASINDRISFLDFAVKRTLGFDTKATKFYYAVFYYVFLYNYVYIHTYIYTYIYICVAAPKA